MEPFTIQCSTCQSLIRVRNPKMIGQIVNCPKCKSMIQIAEPRQIRVELQRGLVDSHAMTKEALAPELQDQYRLAAGEVHTAAPDEIHNGPPPVASKSASPGEVAPPPVDSLFEPLSSDLSPFDPLPAPPQPMPGAKPPQANPLAKNSPPAASIKQLSVQRSARDRQFLMVAVLGASGVLVAGLLFAGFLFWYRGDASKTQVAGGKNKAANQQAATAEVSKGPRHEPEPAREQTSAPEEASGNNTSANSGATGKQSTELVESVQPSEQPVEPPSKPAVDPTTSSGPITGDLNGASDPASSPATSEPPKINLGMLDQLNKFSDLLERRIEPQLNPGAEIVKTPPTAEELGLNSGPASKALDAVDVSQRLQSELSGLIIPETTPLSVFMNTWNQISGIPTVVDLDSLAAAGIDKNSTLGIKLNDTLTLGQTADAMVQLVGDGVELKPIENRFMLLQASEQQILPRLPNAVKVSDLVSNAEQEKWLLETLAQLSPQHAGKWMIVAGELTADRTAVDYITWFWTVRTIESWRLASGLPSQLSKLEQSKLITHFVDSAKLVAVDKKLDLKIIERGPVAQLLSEFCAPAKVHAWVDWPSVGQKGLGANTLDFVVTQGRTLRQCLHDISEKYGVYIAIEDESSLWITTPISYHSQSRVYVIPSEGKTVEQWLEQLEPYTPIGAAGVEQVRAILTPDSRFVIVRCCRPRLRF